MAGISSEQTADGLKLKLSGEANILQAEAFRQELLRALAAGQGVCLDLSALTSVDLAFVQVILAGQQAAQAQGLGFAFCSGLPAVFTQLQKSAALDNQPWQIKA